ncbi:MAG: aldo/keto reductase [Sedimentisphaerales bacterium]|nr:aldo/keto reductase [Sedimentisphaerales bacterium]
MNAKRIITRRSFLRGIAVGATGAAAFSAFAAEQTGSDAAIATRILGRTNQRIPVLGLGTAPLGEGPVGVEEGIKVFSAAIDRGLTYIDTARIYGNAEEILGHIIPKRRDKLFVVTKVSTDNGRDAEKSLAESLRMLKTDHIDLVHIHSVGGKNIDKVLANDGALEYLLKQKETGKIRFIGVSAHNRPGNVVRMVKTDQIDVVMCVMNYADRNTYDFESKVLPETIKRNVGCIAMKVYVGIKGGFRNHRSGFVGCVTEPRRMPQALAYALDLKGVHAAVIGPYTLEQAVQNVEFARNYKPLTEQQRTELLALGKEIAEQIGPRYGPVI